MMEIVNFVIKNVFHVKIKVIYVLHVQILTTLKITIHLIVLVEETDREKIVLVKMEITITNLVFIANVY